MDMPSTRELCAFATTGTVSASAAMATSLFQRFNIAKSLLGGCESELRLPRAEHDPSGSVRYDAVRFEAPPPFKAVLYFLDGNAKAPPHPCDGAQKKSQDFTSQWEGSWRTPGRHLRGAFEILSRPFRGVKA